MLANQAYGGTQRPTFVSMLVPRVRRDGQYVTWSKSGEWRFGSLTDLVHGIDILLNSRQAKAEASLKFAGAEHVDMPTQLLELVPPI